jgi:hypothetical protein
LKLIKKYEYNNKMMGNGTCIFRAGSKADEFSVSPQETAFEV